MSQSQASKPQPLPKIQSFRFKPNPYIGHGFSSRVYKATADDDAAGAKKGNEYALKIFNEGCDQEKIEREIDMWNAVNTLDLSERDFFVKFYGRIKSDKHERRDVLIFELCKEDTYQLIYGNERLLVEEEAKKAIRAVAKALRGLERKGIIHRDIKIENILKTSTGNYKLTDLGAAAKYMDTCMKNCKEGRHAYECLQRRFYPDINGPPEAFTGNFLTTKADMWALGVVTTIMITGYYPLGQDVENNLALVLQQSLPNPGKRCDAGLNLMEGFKNFKVRDHEILNRLSGDASDFVSKLLKYDPKERMSASEALEHPWLKEKHTITAPSASASHSRPQLRVVTTALLAALALVPPKRKRSEGFSALVHAT